MLNFQGVRCWSILSESDERWCVDGCNLIIYPHKAQAFIQERMVELHAKYGTSPSDVRAFIGGIILRT